MVDFFHILKVDVVEIVLTQVCNTRSIYFQGMNISTSIPNDTYDTILRIGWEETQEPDLPKYGGSDNGDKLPVFAKLVKDWIEGLADGLSFIFDLWIIEKILK
jgi:hypothetical protein